MKLSFLLVLVDNFSASGGEHENEDHLDSSTDITDKQEECNKHPMNEGVSRNAENEEKAKHCLKCASVQSNDQAINEATSSDNIKSKILEFDHSSSNFGVD